MSLKPQSVSQAAFQKVLEKASDRILLINWDSIVDGRDFQQRASEIICSVACEMGVDVKTHKEPWFPDVTLGQFGVEIKYTKADKWTSVGNSIRESTRVPDIHTIYILFGKGGGQPQVLIRRYEDCLSDIVVTHSPRYSIDMRLPPGKTVFDRMGTTYDAYRLESADSQDRQFAGRPWPEVEPEAVEQLWWLDKEQEVLRVVRTLESIPEEERNQIIAALMVRFPEIFDETDLRTKYVRASRCLREEYRLTSHNLRDHFSASGRKPNPIGTGSVRHVWAELYERAADVSAYLQSVDVADLAESWMERFSKVVSREEVITNPEAAWLKILDHITSISEDGTTLSKMYTRR